MKAVKGGGQNQNANNQNTNNQKPQLKLSRKEAEKQRKETAERISKAVKEGRYLEINVPTVAATEVKTWLESIAGVTVIYSRKSEKDPEKTVISIESKEVVNHDFLTLGAQIKDIEFKAMGLASQKIIKKAEKDRSPASLTFPKELGLAFWEQTTDKDKEALNFIGKHSDIKGETIQLQFGIRDCIGKDDLFKRAFLIAEYADGIRGDLRKKKDMDFIHHCINKMQDFYPIEQKVILFEWVTGKQLIEMGRANIFNSQKKPARFFQRFLNYFSKKREYTYEYYGKVILPESEEKYVIEVRKEITPRLADHSAEIWIRYEFGEQFYRGFGVVLVEHYFNEMVALHNKAFKDAQEAEGKAVTDNAGE